MHRRFRRATPTEEEVPIHKIPDPGTGKGIFFQRLHQQRKATPPVPHPQPERPASEDLVPEQADEGEEM
ncbi:hypothetical protein scyTo_0019774 [Scyliorhinus torazame]|uniref:Uncharacterized protein n=1 Tax=Scyliorhinus torazame TaxID=75743 RepID=A0A401PQW9_SCYTO|nr:hypothetical protein [Scyliorhinus torazame]